MQLLVSAPPTLFPWMRNMRQPLAAASSVVVVAGVAILYAAPDELRYQNLRLGGCMMLAFSGVNYAVTMSVIGANIAGFTKKQFTTSWTFFMYCVIDIITPQTFLGSESPRYHTGLTFVLVYVSIKSPWLKSTVLTCFYRFTVLYIITSLATWTVLMLEIKKSDKLALTDPDYRTGDENLDYMSGLR